MHSKTWQIIVMDFKELNAQIKELVGRDELDMAIQLLSRYFQGDDRLNDILLSSARYHKLQKDQERGMIDFKDVQQEMNQLRYGILKMLDSEEEERKFHKEIFDSDEPDDKETTIPVFFSVGSPHTDEQVGYIEELKKHLLKYQIDLNTLDGGDWDELDPLRPIRKKMESCVGCLVLAMERFHVKEGVLKRGSRQEAVVKEENYATPWSHIEATLAYQLNQPFIILKEKSLRGEGMLDDNLFEWRIVQIDPRNPAELDEYPIKSFIRMWVEEVRKANGKG